MVAQAEEKWKRRFQEVTDEKEEANMKLAELQGKVSIALLVQEIISSAKLKTCYQYSHTLCQMEHDLLLSGFWWGTKQVLCPSWYQPLLYTPNSWVMDHTTSVYVLYSFRKALWALSLHSRIRSLKVLWDQGAVLFEKTKMSNKHLQMSGRRQRILLTYFNTPSVGPAGNRIRAYCSKVWYPTYWVN